MVATPGKKTQKPGLGSTVITDPLHGILVRQAWISWFGLLTDHEVEESTDGKDNHQRRTEGGSAESDRASDGADL